MAGDRWLDTVPVAVFGGSEDDDLVQVTGAVLMGDSVVIADGGAQTLRFYRRTGELLGVVGRRGKGPGEFQAIRWVQRADGRVYAYDSEIDRLSEFTYEGRFVRTLSLGRRAPYTNLAVVGVFEDGSLCVWAVPPKAHRAGETYVSRDPIVLLRYTKDGAYVDSLGTIKSSETFYAPFGRAGGFMAGVVLGRQTDVVVSGDRVYTIENDDHRIVAFDRSGVSSEVTIPSEVQRRVRVTSEDIRIGRDHFLRVKNPRLRRTLESHLETMPVPDFFPSYGWIGERRLTMMRATSTGDVWVLPFGGVRSQGPTWIVYDGSGMLRGYVRSTSEIDVLDAKGDVALVLVWNENDVARVELRRVLPRH